MIKDSEEHENIQKRNLTIHKELKNLRGFIENQIDRRNSKLYIKHIKLKHRPRTGHILVSLHSDSHTTEIYLRGMRKTNLFIYDPFVCPSFCKNKLIN